MTTLLAAETKRNRAKCLKCNSIFESKSVHNYVRCACGECFIDGGKEYSRFGAATDLQNLFLMPYDDEETNKRYNESVFDKRKEVEEKDKEKKKDDVWQLAPLHE